MTEASGHYQEYPFYVYTYKTVDSTNSAAKRAILNGVGMNMTVHLAEEQTEGKGRNGRSWLNTYDPVLMSIVLLTKLSSDKLPVLNLVAAVAVKKALRTLTQNTVDFTVKWPNDVLVSDRLEKVCGILSEIMTKDRAKYAIIGIGVNLNAKEMPDDLLQPASSVYLHYRKYIPVNAAVKEILREFRIQYELMLKDMNAFLKGYAEECISVNHHVSVNDGNGIRYGYGDRLAPHGQLIVRYEDGDPDVIYAADVSVRDFKTVDHELALKLLPKRKPTGNKGDFGRALLIVGSEDMPGAALMATKACIRTGAGLTRVLIPKELVPSFAAVPEAMLISDDSKIDEALKWATAIGIGCGMGVSERTGVLMKKVLGSGKPCVIDADALNKMSRNKEIMDLLHKNALITPHPNEMARLISCDVKDVLKKFTPTAVSFAKEHNCCVLLKSPSTIIVSPEGEIRYNDFINSGLAKGGSGDVLTGIITSLAAQKVKLFDAASLGSYLLGVSADKALRFLHNRFIEATDIVDIIASEINEGGIL